MDKEFGQWVMGDVVCEGMTIVWFGEPSGCSQGHSSWWTLHRQAWSEEAQTQQAWREEAQARQAWQEEADLGMLVTWISSVATESWSVMPLSKKNFQGTYPPQPPQEWRRNHTKAGHNSKGHPTPLLDLSWIYLSLRGWLSL